MAAIYGYRESSVKLTHKNEDFLSGLVIVILTLAEEIPNYKDFG